MKNKKITIGITGGIGSGKSTVAKMIAEKGYPVLSADEIAREVTEPGGEGLKKIAQAFGPSVLKDDGTLNRGWLREQISRSPMMRATLDSITHPLIQAVSRERAEKYFAQGASLVFYEAPLLFEANSHRRLDGVICVHADDQRRVDRVVKRDGRDAGEVLLLLRGQMPQEEKLKLSEYHIANENGLDELRAQVDKVLAAIKNKFSV
jgi:dephospho-CoA kinase